MSPEGCQVPPLGTDGRHGLGLHSHAVQRSSWVSIGPEQEDTLQVAAGTSPLGDLQRWQLWSGRFRTVTRGVRMTWQMGSQE